MSGEEMPAALRKLGEDAKKRVQGRRCAPTPLNPDPSQEDGFFVSPYRQEDWEPWAFLLLDAFGTRSFQVANAFMLNLRAMCPEIWKDDVRGKDPHAFEQAVAIVSSLRPATEAEAAHAAGLVAVHFATMKVAERIGANSYVDPRMANALSGLVRTYGTGMQAMKSRKARAKPQVIKVEKHVTVNYDNRQVHLSPKGCGDGEGRPYGAEPLRAGARDAASPFECAALLGANETGNAVPETFNKGPEALPASRVREGGGWPEEQGERELPARGPHGGGDQPASGGGDTVEEVEGSGA